MKEFIFGTFVYEYHLVRQERRTLSLTVTPDLRIIVKCPLEADGDRVEAFLQRKWMWLEKQLSFFQRYQRKLYKKEYISGEGYLYLGRQYRLVVRRGKADLVLLTRGQLVVETAHAVADGVHNKSLVDEWFKAKAEMVFRERFAQMLPLFDLPNIPKLSIRGMPKRWGSYLRQDRVVLNPKLIHTSKECIDYVIIHELCHMRYKNHDKKFYNFLDQKFPKWEKVKEKLEITGSIIC